MKSISKLDEKEKIETGGYHVSSFFVQPILKKIVTLASRLFLFCFRN
jgi:hypothetical protein